MTSQRKSCRVCGYSYRKLTTNGTCNTCHVNGYKTSTDRRKAKKAGTHMPANKVRRILGLDD